MSLEAEILTVAVSPMVVNSSDKFCYKFIFCLSLRAPKAYFANNYSSHVNTSAYTADEGAAFNEIFIQRTIF